MLVDINFFSVARPAIANLVVISFKSNLFSIIHNENNITVCVAGGEGFFAGSRYGGFTKQMMLIWAILSGLQIHINSMSILGFT